MAITGWGAAIDASSAAVDKLGFVKRYRSIFLLTGWVVLFVAAGAAAVVAADKCKDTNGTVLGFMTRTQICVHK